MTCGTARGCRGACSATSARWRSSRAPPTPPSPSRPTGARGHDRTAAHPCARRRARRLAAGHVYRAHATRAVAPRPAGAPTRGVTATATRSATTWRTATRHSASPRSRGCAWRTVRCATPTARPRSPMAKSTFGAAGSGRAASVAARMARSASALVAACHLAIAARPSPSAAGTATSCCGASREWKLERSKGEVLVRACVTKRGQGLRRVDSVTHRVRIVQPYVPVALLLGRRCTVAPLPWITLHPWGLARCRELRGVRAARPPYKRVRLQVTAPVPTTHTGTAHATLDTAATTPHTQ